MTISLSVRVHACTCTLSYYNNEIWWGCTLHVVFILAWQETALSAANHSSLSLPHTCSVLTRPHTLLHAHMHKFLIFLVLPVWVCLPLIRNCLMQIESWHNSCWLIKMEVSNWKVYRNSHSIEKLCSSRSVEGCWDLCNNIPKLTKLIKKALHICFCTVLPHWETMISTNVYRPHTTSELLSVAKISYCSWFVNIVWSINKNLQEKKEVEDQVQCREGQA